MYPCVPLIEELGGGGVGRGWRVGEKGEEEGRRRRERKKGGGEGRGRREGERKGEGEGRGRRERRRVGEQKWAHFQSTQHTHTIYSKVTMQSHTSPSSPLLQVHICHHSHIPPKCHYYYTYTHEEGFRSWNSHANPRSDNLMCPTSSNKILDGFKSLYTIFCLCMCSRASNISQA